MENAILLCLYFVFFMSVYALPVSRAYRRLTADGVLPPLLVTPGQTTRLFRTMRVASLLWVAILGLCFLIAVSEDLSATFRALGVLTLVSLHGLHMLAALTFTDLLGGREVPWLRRAVAVSLCGMAVILLWMVGCDQFLPRDVSEYRRLVPGSKGDYMMVTLSPIYLFAFWLAGVAGARLRATPVQPLLGAPSSIA